MGETVCINVAIRYMKLIYPTFSFYQNCIDIFNLAVLLTDTIFGIYLIHTIEICHGKNTGN